MSFAISNDTLKMILAILILMSGILGVMTPRLFDPFGTKISAANLISCGVILSAALVHLMGDATESLNNAPLPKLSDGSPYPWSFMICGLSFILLFFFERLLIHQLLHNHHHHGHDHPVHLHTAISGKGGKAAIVLNEPKAIPLMADAQNVEPHHDHHHGVLSEHAEDMVSLLKQKNYFSSIVLMMGLGVHSILSGVALGSSTADSEAVSLGVAILSHKYLASFAVGVPLNKSVISLRVTAAIAFCFSMLTPIGILLGFLLRSSFSSMPWISDIFISVAAGTFLYVSICEILLNEFSEDKKIERKLYQSIAAQSIVNNDCANECDTESCKPKQHDDQEWCKMLCVLLGFTMMSVLAIYT